MLKGKDKKWYAAIVGFLGSRAFFWIIIGFFVLEALWLAISLRYPMLYDERFHFPLIQQYAHQWSPWLAQPPRTYPVHIFAYHYLLSWPYRLIDLITSSQMAQVVFLRVINIIMVAFGLVFFGKLFRHIGIKRIYANLALLILVLLPVTPLVAATVNYDNLLFLLTACYMFVAVKIIINPKVSWQHFAGIITLGCFASLAKFTFLPLFGASVIYLAIMMWRRHHMSFFRKLRHSIKDTRKRCVAGLALGLIVSVSPFIILFGHSLVRYHTVQPECSKVFSREYCVAENGVSRRDIIARETKNQRPVTPLPFYSLEWVNGMAQTGGLTGSGVVGVVLALPAIYILIFFGTLLAVGVLIYAWRSLEKNQSWYFLLTMVVVLTASIFAVNAMFDYDTRTTATIQARYLLNMLPVFIAMALVASAYVLRQHNFLKISALVIVLLLFTQGGGVITHIVQSQDSWYWQNPTVIRANHAAKKVLDPLVRQSYGNYGF